MFSLIFERHQTNWDILYKKDTGVIHHESDKWRKRKAEQCDRQNE